MRPPLSLALTSIATTLITSAHIYAEAPRPIKALMLVGGDYHDYKTLPPQLAERLNQRGSVVVDVTNDWASIDSRRLEPYQVFIENTCQRPQLTDAFKRAVIDHVRSGKGLVVVHCSLWSYVDWPEWTQLMGGRVETHDKYTTYDVVVLDPMHATMLSLGNRFTITDEPYLVDQRDPDATVLVETAEARHDAKGNLRSGPDPQVWVKRFGKGRIFVTTFGHDAVAQQSEPFLTLMHNGIRWAGGLTNDAAHNELTKSERQVGFELLFNGRDLAGWQADAGLWAVENGELVGCGKDLAQSKPLLARERFGDFVLRFSFKHVHGKGAVLIGSEQPGHSTEGAGGYHVELAPGRWGSLAGAPAKSPSNLLPAHDAQALVVEGGWNDVTIQAAGPDLTVRVNGVTAGRCTRGDEGMSRAGRIGFELSPGPEPAEIYLRDIRLRRLEPNELQPQSRPD